MKNKGKLYVALEAHNTHDTKKDHCNYFFFHEITAHENFVKSLQQFLFRFAHFCEYHACIHMHDLIENS